MKQDRKPRPDVEVRFHRQPDIPTLQDLDAGCHTEIDMFSGALVRMGKELGIPMPYNEYTYHND